MWQSGGGGGGGRGGGGGAAAATVGGGLAAAAAARWCSGGGGGAAASMADCASFGFWKCGGFAQILGGGHGWACLERAWCVCKFYAGCWRVGTLQSGKGGGAVS